MTKVTIKAPATIANIVCGFDILGLCLHEPFDVMEVSLISEKKVIISSEGNGQLPTEPHLNTAGAPLLEMLKELDADFGFKLHIQKNIKPGSGLGSSAASAAGAVFAANCLLGDRYSKTELVRFAMAKARSAVSAELFSAMSQRAWLAIVAKAAARSLKWPVMFAKAAA